MKPFEGVAETRVKQRLLGREVQFTVHQVLPFTARAGIVAPAVQRPQAAVGISFAVERRTGVQVAQYDPAAAFSRSCDPGPNRRHLLLPFAPAERREVRHDDVVAARAGDQESVVHIIRHPFRYDRVFRCKGHGIPCILEQYGMGMTVGCRKFLQTRLRESIHLLQGGQVGIEFAHPGDKSFLRSRRIHFQPLTDIVGEHPKRSFLRRGACRRNEREQ